MDAGRIPRPPGGADARAGHVTASTATIHIDRAPMPTRSPQQPPPPGPPHERPAPRPARRRERPRGRLGRAVPPPPRPAPRSPPRPPAWPPRHRHAPPPRRPSPAPPPAPARRAVRSPRARPAARSSRKRSMVASRRPIRSPSRPLSAVAAAGRPSGCGWPSLDRGRPASTRISRPRLPLRLVMVPRRASDRSRSGFQPVARAASGTASHAAASSAGTAPSGSRKVHHRALRARSTGWSRPCADHVPLSCPAQSTARAAPGVGRHAGPCYQPPAMLDLTDVTLRIAGRPLLEGANLHVPAATRLALVGRNGTGKSTLLRLIAGELQPDQGEIRMPSVAQDRHGPPGGAGRRADPARRPCSPPTPCARRLLAEARAATDPVRIAELHQRLVEIGADAAPCARRPHPEGPGLRRRGAGTSRSARFSGGWRMRVALAGVLFLEPDLLLLDEPTNHLDLEAAIWLEEHLRRYPRTLILVSHDRDFLNSVPQKTCHLEGRKLTLYAGGYDQFERTRRERLVLAEKARERQAAERAHIQSFVDRFRYKASKARQAQSRIKMLERMEPIAQALIEPEIRFSFPAGSVPAPPMITMDGAPRRLWREDRARPASTCASTPTTASRCSAATATASRTFAKLVAGRLEPMAGELVRARGLKVGFFAQHQIEDLVPEETPLQHIQTRRPERARAADPRLARPLRPRPGPGPHPGPPPLRRREDPARLGADVPRRAAAPDPRRAHQPSRHRQPRGPGRGGQRVPGCGHRHQPRPPPGRAGRRLPVAGRRRPGPPL